MGACPKVPCLATSRDVIKNGMYDCLRVISVSGSLHKANRNCIHL